MRPTDEMIKNTFELLLLVSTKKCPIRMLLLMISKGSKALQGNQQEQEERQVYQKLEIGTCAYLIFKSGSDAMHGTDDKHHEQIAQYSQFPRLKDWQMEDFSES